MKVFVVGREESDTFAHNVAHTLRAMGHEVLSDPRSPRTMIGSRRFRALHELLDRASPTYRQVRERRVQAMAAASRPDLTLICTATLEPESVDAIRRSSGGRVVCWYTDAAANLRREHLLSGEYDAVFAKDPDFVERLRDLLGIEAHLLEEACNPDWHRPVEVEVQDVVRVAGSAYGWRVALVDRLLAAGEPVELYGGQPGPWLPPRVAAAHTGRFLDHRDKAASFGGALACLNSFHPAEGPRSLNCRVFETCGSGAVLLSEARPALERCFEPETECLTFTSLEACREQLARLRREPERGRQLRRRAARRAHAEHSYQQRLAAMLDVLARS